MMTNSHVQPGRANALITLLALVLSALVAASLRADATVYRCGPAGSQWYSQIPCSENAEPMLIRDQHKLSEPETPEAESASANSNPAQAAESAQETAPASNAEAFIQQLEKQRSEQLAEIDRNIARLENASSSAGEDGTPLADDETAALIAGLQNTRESIVSEYDAMIRAARQGDSRP